MIRQALQIITIKDKNHIMGINALLLTATTVGTAVALKILGALTIWIIGRWVISLVMALTRKGMEARHVDATLSSRWQHLTSKLGLDDKWIG